MYTCHGGLVALHLVGDDHYAVGGYLHSVVDLHYIANHELALMDVERHAVSDQIDHLPGVTDGVKQCELLLFLVIVDRGEQTGDQHCHQNRESLDPGGGAVRLVGDHLHD